MPRTAANYDVELIRQAAAARWPEIISNLAGVDIRILDGEHHPCPKCGGTDRFRFFTDQTGGAICNQCFRTKNGDGFSVLQWLKGCGFQDALADIANYLGIQPSTNGSQKPRRRKSSGDPAEHLTWLPWSDDLVAIWCLSKPPIKPAAVQQIGGRLARYRGQWTVIAIPILGSAGDAGWTLYEITGGSLPKFDKTGKVKEWKKVKITFGSNPGLHE